MGEIIDGRKMREAILSELAERVRKEALEPKLAIVQVGDDAASSRYIEQKRKAAEEIGASVNFYHLNDETTFSQLKKLIAKLNRDKRINGIIIQLPLPGLLHEEEKVVDLVLETKDVDGFKENSPFQSATPSAVLEILRREFVIVKNKVVVIVGRGKLVGRPLYTMLSGNKDITELIQVYKEGEELRVFGSSEKAKPLDFYTKQADILVSATGQTRLIKGNMLKPGAVVIDVGISVDQETGKLTGDVDFETAKAVASKITPVPGGVGPMTVAMLLKNLVEAATRHPS